MKIKLSVSVILLLLFNVIQAQVNGKTNRAYTIEQATSDKAQLHTIAFDGLAFLTGSFGADCFFPPGKVADFFGFQYMRDNDNNSLGHNTDFLTRIANNVLNILNKDQLNKFIALAKEQELLYTDFSSKRMVLIKAFRQSLQQELPQNSMGLNKEAVIEYCGDLYAIDAELSYRRAEVMGDVIRSFTEDQKKAFSKLDFGNSASWPVMPETVDKRSMSHRAHVGLMTYASELFSWYKGSETADVYFCPERHGTYFGGFYLKDYPAMGNAGYSISTSLTGDAGESFLQILDPEQRKLMEALPVLQKKNLENIVTTRRQVAESLRKFIKGENVDKKIIKEWLLYYGRQDGEMSWYYCNAFSLINKSLTAEQKDKLKKLRNLEQLPSGTYLYSDPVPVPADIVTSFLFFPPAVKVQ